MDKNREGDRGDKRTPGLPQGLDPATAALYAPWLHQEQALLSNMLSGGMGAYAASMGGLGGLHPGFPPVSSSAGLAGLAAAQQAQQAAALASLGPSAAWWNLANLQQMELLSRLGGGGLGASPAGLGGYPGLHPEHLLNLEMLQAQHAMAAAVMASSKGSSSSASGSSSSAAGPSGFGGGVSARAIGSSKASSSSSSHRAVVSSMGGRTSTNTTSSSSHHHHSSSHHGHYHHSSPSSNSSSSRSSISRDRESSHLHHPHSGSHSSPGLGTGRSDPTARSSSRSSPLHYGRRSHLLGSLEGASPSSSSSSSPHNPSAAAANLSYGIASLMADKLPGQKSSQAEHSPANNRLSSNGVSISKAIRNKELEIIPISSSTPKSSRTDPDGGLSRTSSALPPYHREKSEPKVSISAVGSAPSGLQLSNGLLGSSRADPHSHWREEVAKVSIEPCGSAALQAAAAAAASSSAGGDDGPLNLSMKSPATITPRSGGSKDRKDLSSLGFGGMPPGLNPFAAPGSSNQELFPSLEMLQSLYGGQQAGADSVNVLASMQDALQRQLLAADEKKREEKKKRMEEAQERARHLGRGVSKPKKNTVASLLEHCRAAGIKPQIPLPAVSTSPSPSLPLPPNVPSSPIPSVSVSPLPPVPSLSAVPPAVVTLPPSLTVTSIARTDVSPVRISPAPTVTTAAATISKATVVTTTTTGVAITTTTIANTNSVEVTPVLTTSTNSTTSNTPSQSPVPQENGGAVVRKRHLVASSSMDGRLVTTIKMASAPPPPRELSDASDSDDSDLSSVSTIDDDGEGGRFPSPWLKRSADGLSPTRSNGSPPAKKRKMITDEAMLRMPLLHGWRRETAMRGVTQSGVRGEVVYHAPCGKTFRQYPDIIRYLERHNITQITRDNFSFSSKIPVGEYIDANTGQKYSENDIRETIDDIRKAKGYRPYSRHRDRSSRKHSATPPESGQPKSNTQPGSNSSTTPASAAGSPKPATENTNSTPKGQDGQANNKEGKDGRDALEMEAEAILRRLEAEEKLQKMKALKEQERLKKQEELKKEKEEKEQEKLKAKQLKEQLYLQELNKQRELLYTLELERERRRYHGVLVKALENRKRYEDREKRREELREEKRVSKERKKEERMAARELNILLKEVKEDMELTDHRQLPVVPRLQGLKLPPEAFGNALMIFEFLHNFGETLGFDMESLPSLQSLQLALMNDQECEEELLSVLTHLLVCAIEDPGIPSPQKHTTMLGQTLNRADITHANISEILRVYLLANATGEVKVIHSLQGTEKERRDHPSKAQEWDDKLAETDACRMSNWLGRLPFLALNATQKSEIIAYVCNELLQNKAVIRQIEDSLDRHNGLKTEKWKVDAKIRKLRMTVGRKKFYAAKQSTEGRNGLGIGHTPAPPVAGGEDSNMSTSSSTAQWDGVDKNVEKKVSPEEEEEPEEEENENDSGNDSDPMEEVPDEEDSKHINMNTDDAAKTLDLLQREMNQVRQQLFETAQQVRGYNCGQDRFQRTMWVLPHAGGPFLEGLSSCDYTGRRHFSLDIPDPDTKKGLLLHEVPYPLGHQPQENKEDTSNSPTKMEEGDDGNVKKETKDEIKEENTKNIKDEKMVNGDQDRTETLNKQILDIEIPDIPPKDNKDIKESKDTKDVKDIKDEKDEKDVKDPETPAKVKDEAGIKSNSNPPNGLKEGMTSEVDKDLVATGLGLIPGQYLRPEHITQCEKLYFSLFPRICCEFPVQEIKQETIKDENNTKDINSTNPLSPNTNGNAAVHKLSGSLGVHNLSHKELLERLHQSAEALPIPAEFKTGWWHFNDLQLLEEMLESLNERGVRERELKRFIEKNYNIVKKAVSKVDPESTQLEMDVQEACPDEPPILYDEYATPVADDPCHWSPDVVLKVDLATLEAVYNMEEKITNASMQNKSWKLSESGDRPSPENIRPSCLPKTDPTDTRIDPVQFGKARLLALEEGIERRYLKPPLGKCVPPNPKGGEPVAEIKTSESCKGLASWREAVSKVETAAQLAMCTYMLETAVAWDKSIMKAYCQFCHSGDFEEKLLLCDGCDKGYHTHCFKPAVHNIPDGDWYCFECLNKFSDGSQRHCLVCGGIEGRNLVACSTCFRAYHTNCITPNLTKVPRSKWCCPACSSKSPKGRRGRHKKVQDNAPSPASNSNNTSSQPSTPAPAVNNSTPPEQPLSESNTPPPTSSDVGSPASPTPAEFATPNGGEETAPPTSVQSPAPSHPTPQITATATPTTTPTATPKKERANKKKNQQAAAAAAKEQTNQNNLRELTTCKGVLSELETHDDAWPFLLPVNTRQFPTYKKIIKKPMDLSTIRKKLEEGLYKTRDDYCEDLRLMFSNCEIFNEDDSPVGKAGHSLGSFFEAKWNDYFPAV